jgi:hypothetical protein
MPRRFPPPWSVEETEACFIVRDANGQAPGGARTVAKRQRRTWLPQRKVEEAIYCVARADRRAGKRPVMFGF